MSRTRTASVILSATAVALAPQVASAETGPETGYDRGASYLLSGQMGSERNIGDLGILALTSPLSEKPTAPYLGLASKCLKQARKGMDTGDQMGHMIVRAKSAEEGSGMYNLQAEYRPAKMNLRCRTIISARESYVSFTGDPTKNTTEPTVLGYFYYPGAKSTVIRSRYTAIPWRSEGGHCFEGSVEEIAILRDGTKIVIKKSPKTAFFVPRGERIVWPNYGVKDCEEIS